jgi:hypothetical protein
MKYRKWLLNDYVALLKVIAFYSAKKSVSVGVNVTMIRVQATILPWKSSKY